MIQTLRWGEGVSKNFSDGSENKGGTFPLGPSRGSATDQYPLLTIMLSLHYTYLGDVILARELLDLGEGDKNATGKKLLLHFILLH